MAKEIKRYLGTRMPVLGTPVVFIGLENDDDKHTLFYEIHVFFEGSVKAYSTNILEANYDDLRADDVPGYLEVANRCSDYLVQEMIEDAMDANHVPRDFFKPLEVATEVQCFIPTMTLWVHGLYDEEFQNVVQNSKFFKTEFSSFLKYPKMTLRIAGAK